MMSNLCIPNTEMNEPGLTLPSAWALSMMVVPSLGTVLRPGRDLDGRFHPEQLRNDGDLVQLAELKFQYQQKPVSLEARPKPPGHFGLGSGLGLGGGE